MCGIAGIISLTDRPIDPRCIKPMCDVIAHRGPDDAGYAFFQPGPGNTGESGYWTEFVDPAFAHRNEHLSVLGSEDSNDEFSKYGFKVAFGHRRLSILDLSSHGHQPMASSDRRYWITYNGEIYNYRELREELKNQGHVFRTGTDTEVILALWQEYGQDCLPMLNGMFAFAIYDRAGNTITLARDRFGVKPVYYAESSGYLIFGSEIKTLVKSDHISPEICKSSLVQYFTFQNLFGDRTLFKGIKLLKPGQFLSVKPGNTVSRQQEYYNERIQVDHSLVDKPEETREQVAETFQRAVKRQLVSDVEVGAYLSGGMDSGSIVAVAGRELSRLLTFTCGFDLTNVNGIEQGFDEREQSERLSYLLQTEHYEVVLHAGDMPAAMEKLSWHLDDPRVGMCHQNWYAAKLASKFVKVCLSGAGGDELFGGYPWRYREILDCKDFVEFDDRCFAYWHRMLDANELPALFSFDLSEECDSTPRNVFDEVLLDAPAYDDQLTQAENMLQRALFFEKKTFLHGLFVVEDRISMAHSLEVRVPFVDNELAELAWRIPPCMKIDAVALSRSSRNHITSSDGKLVLRRSMEKFVPREFTQQSKQGFSPPDENWYRGPSMDYIRQVLLAENASLPTYWNRSTVAAELEAHFRGTRNNRLLIWSFLCLKMLQKNMVERHDCPEHVRRRSDW